ncbi:MAG: MarR family winged helix-turn-helix transcriptional regulator [Mangrovibacterium sp.]
MKSIGYMLGQTMRVYKHTMSAALRENKIDLSFEQFIMLMFLSLEKEPTQQNIACQLQKDKSIILRHTNILIKKQYVIKVPDENDKRMKKLVLTSKGSEMVSLLKTIAKLIENQLLSGISKKALDTSMEVLSQIQLNGGLEEEFYQCGK